MRSAAGDSPKVAISAVLSGTLACTTWLLLSLRSQWAASHTRASTPCKSAESGAADMDASRDAPRARGTREMRAACDARDYDYRYDCGYDYVPTSVSGRSPARRPRVVTRRVFSGETPLIALKHMHPVPGSMRYRAADGCRHVGVPCE